jgi:Choline/Carnitine o-acyltransferase
VACCHQIPPKKALCAWTLIGAVRTSFVKLDLPQQLTHRWMFDCCRIPGPQGLDWSISYAKDGDAGDSGHIIILRNNRVWKVDIAKDGRLLSTHEIEK